MLLYVGPAVMKSQATSREFDLGGVVALYIKKGNLQLGASEARTPQQALPGKNVLSIIEGILCGAREQAGAPMMPEGSRTMAVCTGLLKAYGCYYRPATSSSRVCTLRPRLWSSIPGCPSSTRTQAETQTCSPCSSQSACGQNRRPRHGGSSSLTTWQDLVSQHHGWVCQ